MKPRIGFHELSDKDIKSLKILKLISKKGVISRTEISKITGINIVSISNYINKYIDNKLIIEKGFDVSTGGRKPELIELDNNNRIIGADIGRDYIRVVLTDIGLNIIGMASAPAPAGADDAAASARGLIEEVIKKAGLVSDAIRAIGIGIRFGNCADIDKEIREAFHAEVFVGDGPSCAAFGERTLNKKIPSGDLLYIHSDIGCGILIKEDGNRLTGDGGVRYLSAWKESLSVVSLARTEVARGVGTSIVELAGAKMENITVETVTESAGTGDEVGLSIMRSVGVGLGLRIAYLINLFNPKSVVIGGGIENSGELILEPITKTVKKLALKSLSRAVVIMPGSLGDKAISLGAASLAAREIFLRT